jgi:hypothetical protein
MVLFIENTHRETDPLNNSSRGEDIYSLVPRRMKKRYGEATILFSEMFSVSFELGHTAIPSTVSINVYFKQISTTL